MNQRDRFIEARRGDWSELDRLLERRLIKQRPETISRVARLYRALCSDLMRARALGCTPDVTANLDALASRAHNALYGPRGYSLRLAWRTVSVEFPRALRRSWAFFVFATLLFAAPLAVGVVATLHDPEFALHVMPPSALEQLANAYSEGFTEGRTSDLDALMTGFYVNNNISIAFRCFATGILFGFGSMFFLIYNGLTIGTVIGYVVSIGAGYNLLTFISGHAPFELTAIVISGCAGLRMGYALVETGGLTRLASLRRQARDLARMIIGAASMLLIAALVEGFWSPSSLPAQVKWLFAGLMTTVVGVFLVVSGRQLPKSRATVPNTSSPEPSASEDEPWT